MYSSPALTTCNIFIIVGLFVAVHEKIKTDYRQYNGNLAITTSK
jgi:hypothetical protein